MLVELGPLCFMLDTNAIAAVFIMGGAVLFLCVFLPLRLLSKGSGRTVTSREQQGSAESGNVSMGELLEKSAHSVRGRERHKRHWGKTENGGPQPWNGLA